MQSITRCIPSNIRSRRHVFALLDLIIPFLNALPIEGKYLAVSITSCREFRVRWDSMSGTSWLALSMGSDLKDGPR